MRDFHARIHGEKLKFLETTFGLLTWEGSYCVSIGLSSMKLEFIRAVEIMNSLPTVNTQRVELSTCLP